MSTATDMLATAEETLRFYTARNAKLIAQRNALAAALARIVTFETADENDDAFLSIAEDANERGMGAADVRRELIDAARAALAGTVREVGEFDRVQRAVEGARRDSSPPSDDGYDDDYADESEHRLRMMESGGVGQDSEPYDPDIHGGDL